MRQAQHLHELRPSLTGAIGNSLLDAFLVVRVNEVTCELAGKSLLAHAQQMSYGRVLEDDGAIPVQDSENVARILDQRAIEVLAGGRARRCHIAFGALALRLFAHRTFHHSIPNPAFCRPSQHGRILSLMEEA